jgi:hypothetical protein
MVKILLAHKKLNQVELNAHLVYIFKKMNGNPVYAMFQALIAALGIIATDYDAALFAAEDESIAKRELKNKLNEEAKLFLTKFVKKVEVAANDLPTEEEALAFAKGTGLAVSETSTTAAKKPLGFLGVPANFNVVNDTQRKGACLGTWDKSLNAVIYLIEEVDDAGKVLNVYSTTQLSLLIEGTASEVKKTYRLRAGGDGTLMSAYTESISVWVR